MKISVFLDNILCSTYTVLNHLLKTYCKMSKAIYICSIMYIEFRNSLIESTRLTNSSLIRHIISKAVPKNESKYQME